MRPRARPGAGPAQARDQKLQNAKRMLRRVDVGRPQIGHQQVIAGEHIQRQEAIAVVIAVEEAPLLMAVHRIVGGIHVQHNLFGRPLEGGDEGRGQNLVNRPRPIPFGPVLEAAQRRRAGQSPVAPGRRLQGKVMAQGRVIVQILVAQRNPEYPLAQQIRHAMAQLAPLTRIAKPARHRRRQAKPAIRLTQQQRTAIARHLTAVETRLDPAPATGWKRKPTRDTIRHRRAPVSDSA